MQEEKIVKMVFSIVEDNIPEDCRWLVKEIEKRIMQDIRELGVEGALKKNYLDSDDEKIDVIIEEP
ncbi:MAG: hypothetical protein OWQ54_05860 [Sulfolobaceae archaeon]|nr:hypothetical protein [Sulfolobaceae archaeon]